MKNLPKDLLESLKGLLTKKDAQLEEEEKELSVSDAYAIPDRDISNSEEVDEAEEDRRHLETQAKMNLVSSSHMRVEKALAKMKFGKYGVCEKCGKPIDKARLNAYPEATTCVECANKL